jgi:Ca-activated chloride channel family protein
VNVRVTAPAVLAGMLALGAPGRGQEPPRRAAPTFGSDVEMVRLDVSVVGRDGRFVTDLTEGDFEIYEDGQRQGTMSFVRQELPVSLVLLLDASISVADRMPQAQAASSRFMEALRPQDEVRVAEFNDRLAVLQESTADRALLQAAINRISAAGSTALYNALYVTLRTLPSASDRSQLRRRVIVLVSDGEDTSSLVWEEQVLELVRRREATIHVIALKAESDASNRSARLLRLLSAESGGEVHHPESIRELDSVYARIGEELRSQYTIGYVSSNAVSDARWRGIELRVRGRKDLQIRHRSGYYALPGGG